MLVVLFLVADPTFVWGAAASAHQTEGLWGKGEASDWHAFEHASPSPIANAETADVAVDFWHRYEEDFAIARRLGLDSVRISIAWEKVEPAPGVFDEEVIAHYRRIVVAMRAAGLRPMIALHHFTHPSWFVARGGWTAEGSAAWFFRYAAHVTFALRDLCELWITFNEPSVLVNLGFVKGDYPPNARSIPAAVQASLNLARAHQAVAAWIHRLQPEKGPGKNSRGLFGVGLVNSLQLYTPARAWHPLDRLFAWTIDALANWSYLHLALRTELVGEDARAIIGARTASDWIGVNYYGRFNVRAGRVRGVCAPDDAVADNGWCIYPDGLETMLKETAARFSLPLIVGENGLADAADRLRPEVIRRSLAALDRSKQTLDVRGYYHWSLTDNFEWLHGYKYRFGLVSVGRDLQRWVRPSGEVYAEEIRKRRLSD
ncbi:MAG: glycoside hydrolase family 1 protein [Deltaproteobacteria bacterium]|nr:glycoside hydrolase family 1 protein [Deltaproteobacteria bacterium]